MPHIDRELTKVWNALRENAAQRDEALEEVRITNLRGHREPPVSIPLSCIRASRGPNGSGKSTVLFACACAYRVPGRHAGDFAPSRLFPNFTSRQAAVRSDPPQETELEFHYVHQGVRRFMTWRRGKSWTRKGDGNSHPERQIYLRTLANLTSPAEVRSILQLGRTQVQAETISPELLIFAHRVLPWRYLNLDLIRGQSSRDLLFAEIDGADETRYSEFHMSSGERTIVRISKDISRLENALVLIDEVDMGCTPTPRSKRCWNCSEAPCARSCKSLSHLTALSCWTACPPRRGFFWTVIVRRGTSAVSLFAATSFRGLCTGSRRIGSPYYARTMSPKV